MWLRGRDALINTDHLAMIFAEDQDGTWVVAGRTTVGERGGIVVVLAEADDEPKARTLLDAYLTRLEAE